MENQEAKQIIASIMKETPEAISPLYGGMMNQSFTFILKNKPYVLYISTKEANQMVNRHLEKENQALVYALGLTSENIYFDEEKGIKINTFIQGDSLDHVTSFDYAGLADLFHQLHSGKALSKEDYHPFRRFVHDYEKEAEPYPEFQNEDYFTLRNVLFSYQKELESRPIVLSHNDAQKSNIIKSTDSHYYFIDFEFMGNNDELYDIACFGNNSVEEGRKLLDAYYQNQPDKEEIRMFYLWRIFISLQWRNVAIKKHYNGEGKTHHFDFLKVADFFLSNAKEAYARLKIEEKGKMC